MAHTYTRLLYHIVYSTKERMPLLTGPWLERMHGYLGGMGALAGVSSCVASAAVPRLRPACF
jgi:hypothetical protein